MTFDTRLLYMLYTTCIYIYTYIYICVCVSLYNVTRLSCSLFDLLLLVLIKSTVSVIMAALAAHVPFLQGTAAVALLSDHLA